MDRTFRKRALRPSPIRSQSESQYRTVLPMRAACERAVHACRHTCLAFPTAANLTVKAGIRSDMRDAETRVTKKRETVGRGRPTRGTEKIITGGKGKGLEEYSKWREAILDTALVKNGNDNDDRGPINYWLRASISARAAV